MTAPLALLLAIPAGSALGLGYFAMVRRSAAELAGGARLMPALWTLGRAAAAAAAFALAARLGAPVLLGAFAGFLGARLWTARLHGRSD